MSNRHSKAPNVELFAKAIMKESTYDEFVSRRARRELRSFVGLSVWTAGNGERRWITTDSELMAQLPRRRTNRTGFWSIIVRAPKMCAAQKRSMM
ncbi:carbohydrate-binding module family 12 protein [Tulasnella calospora MUT 4182]|uniref:Carbohydrate-binding module family 12 protein n=1 Tax=Tulasnella calospora MUT 4182 TaxID=1051891 RepID=A0A0C3QED8_9AGAM|nr:carbohydrate-binding module family 12 protein [Tulasnella calospora MUT 4182]